MTDGRDELRPIDPAVAARIADYDESTREWFWERAAIREFEGGWSRERAERMALADTQRWLSIRCS
jgi:hypothetical protein